MKEKVSEIHHPSSSAPFLRLRDLELRFREAGRTAFSGVSLDFREGEMTSIIGPSGCGKSTLLKSMAGLLQPTSGSIEWRDGKAPELAFIFQDPTLLPWLNVRANVEVPMRLRGQDPRTRKKVSQHMIEQVFLENDAGTYPRELSGGMRMRVSLARALTLKPRLLFLDEPFAALDAITRNQMNGLLLDLQAQQEFGAVLVTHSVNEAIFMSNRVVIMSASPGTVRQTVSIDLPFPRTDALRSSMEFLQYDRTIREQIAREAEHE